MEYMESMMNDRLEASMSEYEQMSDRIKQLEQELAEAKKESAMYWNKARLLNEKLASFGLDEDFEDDAAIKEISK